MRNFFKLSSIAGLILFAGCATWAVSPGGVMTIRDVNLRASVPEGWMIYKPAYGFMMTKDGASLNKIRVKKIKFQQRLSNTRKRFREGMLLPEILEIEIDSLKSSAENFHFKILENKPISIDGREAYRLEYEYEQKGGLKVRAIQCGFVYRKRVYRFVYSAAKIHYFDETVEDFERFLESIELI